MSARFRGNDGEVSPSVSRIANDTLYAQRVDGLRSAPNKGFQNLSSQDGRFRGDF